jgi:hypothetical protein
MTERDLYRILCLEPGAEREDVKAAYRLLSKKYHPDYTGDPATGERFSRVVRAYRILEVRMQKDSYLSSPVSERYRPIQSGKTDIFSLGEMLTSGSSVEVRVMAVRKLGLSGRRSAYVFLRRAFYDPAEAVVRAAVQAVALLGVRQSAGEIASVFTRGSMELKAFILDTAQATGDRLFLSVLEAAAADQDPLVSGRARILLAGFRRP